MAIDPTAVTAQDSSEIAPTCAMLAGSMMIPDPIMLTATSTVSCIRLIFFALGVVFIAWPLRAGGRDSRGRQTGGLAAAPSAANRAAASTLGAPARRGTTALLHGRESQARRAMRFELQQFLKRCIAAAKDKNLLPIRASFP